MDTIMTIIALFSFLGPVRDIVNLVFAELGTNPATLAEVARLAVAFFFAAGIASTIVRIFRRRETVLTDIRHGARGLAVLLAAAPANALVLLWRLVRRLLFVVVRSESGRAKLKAIRWWRPELVKSPESKLIRDLRAQATAWEKSATEAEQTALRANAARLVAEQKARTAEENLLAHAQEMNVLRAMVRDDGGIPRAPAAPLDTAALENPMARVLERLLPGALRKAQDEIEPVVPPKVFQLLEGIAKENERLAALQRDLREALPPGAYELLEKTPSGRVTTDEVKRVLEATVQPLEAEPKPQG